jgi:hypothetical protein
VTQTHRHTDTQTYTRTEEKEHNDTALRQHHRFGLPSQVCGTAHNSRGLNPSAGDCATVLQRQTDRQTDQAHTHTHTHTNTHTHTHTHTHTLTSKFGQPECTTNFTIKPTPLDNYHHKLNKTELTHVCTSNSTDHTTTSCCSDQNLRPTQTHTAMFRNGFVCTTESPQNIWTRPNPQLCSCLQFVRRCHI